MRGDRNFRGSDSSADDVAWKSFLWQMYFSTAMIMLAPLLVFASFYRKDVGLVPAEGPE